MSNFIQYEEVNKKLILLNENYESILSEYANNIKNLEFRDFTIQQKNHIQTHREGYPIGYSSYFSASRRDFKTMGWHLAPLFAEGNPLDFNTSKLPILTSILKEIGILSACAINALDPEQSLDWHIDKDYIPGVQLLRIIWGLDIDPNDPEDAIIQIMDDNGEIETKSLTNKSFYIFHPMSKHRVENKMKSCRSVLCIDYITDKNYSVGFL